MRRAGIGRLLGVFKPAPAPALPGPLDLRSLNEKVAGESGFVRLNPDPAIEKFFQNGKPGLGRFASCVATSTRIAVFGLNRDGDGKPIPFWE